MRLVLALWLGLLAGGSARPPSIVVILADDLGYSDVGSFGGEIPTPNLDRLAAQGLRLTRCFNAGMCVASRSSLLTGRWWPTGLKHFRNDQLLPERLQAAGFRTALIGKWHLPGHPMDRGFDHFFGFLGGFADHFAGSADYRLNRDPFVDFGDDYYSTCGFTDRAIQFIKATDPERPFFLMLAHQAPHNPLQAPTSEIARHRGRYLDGWDSVRGARIRRQRELGILPRDAPLPSRPQNLPAWDRLSAAQHELEDLRMATYAAMVDILDRETGRFLDALQATGRADDTLLVFLSDNGADPFSVADRAMLAKGKLPGDPRSNFQPGNGWAWTSNAPWRLHKISQHSGGVTTGAILHWPATIKGKGGIESSPVHFTDLTATILAAAGLDAQVPDGDSFLPLLRGQEWVRARPMFFHYADNRAIRTTSRTLVEVDSGGWELYDSRIDPLEADDLANGHPAEVRRLAAIWDRWWREQHGQTYVPSSTIDSPHYSPQGDRGTGRPYRPSALPPSLHPDP